MSRSLDTAEPNLATGIAGWPPWELDGAWEAARGGAHEALEHWRSSPSEHRGAAFCVHRAPAGREDAAAAAWMAA